jgi:hypothetical protein
MSSNTTPSTPLDADLADVARRLGNAKRENQVLAEMYAYNADLRRQGVTFARAKVEYERRRARVVLRERAAGEKSASICDAKADDDQAVYEARLAYRLAEQMVAADRESLRRLHAELDQLRTEAADRRAADAFTARTQT